MLTYAPHAWHASSSPRWADLIDDPTHVHDSDKDDVSMTHMWHKHVNQHPVSWHVSTIGPTCHELSWPKPSLSQAMSRGIGSSVANLTCNQIWDWIWAVHQAIIVLMKSQPSEMRFRRFQTCFQLIWLFRMQWYSLIIQIETRYGGGELLREIAQSEYIWRSLWWSMVMMKKKVHMFTQLNVLNY